MSSGSVWIVRWWHWVIPAFQWQNLNTESLSSPHTIMYNREHKERT